MEITHTIYNISREDLPILKELEVLADSRQLYFEERYENTKKNIEESNKRRIKKRNVFFFFDLMEKLFPNVKFESSSFYNPGNIIIKAKNTLTKQQQERFLTTMNDLGEMLLKKHYVTIDIREEPLFKKAISFSNGGEVIDKWMIGHYLYQFHYSIGDFNQIMKKEEGVYSVPCTYEILGKEKEEIEDFHRMFQDIEECLIQDIPGFEGEKCSL